MFVIQGFLEHQYENNSFAINFPNFDTWKNETYKYIKLSPKSTILECLVICIGVEKEMCDFFTFQVILG